MLMIKEENEFCLMKRKMETGFINPEQLTALHQNLNMYFCGQLQLEQKTNTENQYRKPFTKSDGNYDQQPSWLLK